MLPSSDEEAPRPPPPAARRSSSLTSSRPSDSVDQLFQPFRNSCYGDASRSGLQSAISSRSDSDVTDSDFEAGNTDYWSSTLWRDFCGSTTFHGWYFLGDRGVGQGTASSKN